MDKIKLEKENGKIKVFSPYNQEFIEQARNLKGEWKNNSWIFDESVYQYVKNTLNDIFGVTGEETYEECSLLIKNWSNTVDRGPVVLFGRTIARAYGRDSGAKLGEDIIFVEGTYKSSGSVKNWRTEVENATFEIQHFPLVQTEKENIKKAINEGWVEVKHLSKKRSSEEINADILKCEKQIEKLKKELNDL